MFEIQNIVCIKDPQNSNIFKFLFNREVLRTDVQYLCYSFIYYFAGEPHIDGEPGDLKFIIRELRYQSHAVCFDCLICSA